MSKGAHNPDAGWLVRLGYALRPTGLPWITLPIAAPRYAVYVRLDGFLLECAANDEGTAPLKG